MNIASLCARMYACVSMGLYIIITCWMIWGYAKCHVKQMYTFLFQVCYIIWYSTSWVLQKVRLSSGTAKGEGGENRRGSQIFEIFLTFQIPPFREHLWNKISIISSYIEHWQCSHCYKMEERISIMKPRFIICIC